MRVWLERGGACNLRARRRRKPVRGAKRLLLAAAQRLRSVLPTAAPAERSWVSVRGVEGVEVDVGGRRQAVRNVERRDEGRVVLRPRH